MTEKIGKFEVIELLGRGAMGMVYKGHDPSLARKVAIKVMTAHLEMDPELRARFFREAQAAGSLQHPNIITIFELGESEGKPFIAMEYVPGRDLDDIIAAREPLTIVEKVDLIEQVCRGLSFAHERRIVHRDIKPANIRVTEMGQVKVMDFGVAHLVSSDLTATGSLVGTPYYMAPEVINGETVDARADIFSMGATFYELLSYNRPFQGNNLQSVFRKILHEDPPTLRDLGLDVPPVIQQVLDRSLAKRPRDRYSDTGDFLKDLMTFWETLPAPAQARAAATTALGRAASKAAREARRRWGWKRLIPAAAAAAIALAGLLIVGGAFFGTMFFEPVESDAGTTPPMGQVATAESAEGLPDGSPGGGENVADSTAAGTEEAGEGTTEAAEGSLSGVDEPQPAGGAAEPEVAAPDPAAAARAAEAERITRARSRYESARRAADLERDEAWSLDALTLASTPFARGEAAKERALRAADSGRYSDAEDEMRRAQGAYSAATTAAVAAWRARLDSARARVDSLRSLADPGSPDYRRAEGSLRAATGAEEDGRYSAALESLAGAAEAFRDAVPAEEPVAAEPEPAGPSPDEIVQATLDQLRQAIESENLRALHEVWVGLTADELEGFEALFDSSRDLEVNFDVESTRPARDRIHLSVRTVYRYYNETTRRRDRQSFVQDMELAPGDGRWVVVSSRG